jgi:hypothetical protein
MVDLPKFIERFTDVYVFDRQPSGGSSGTAIADELHSGPLGC